MVRRIERRTGKLRRRGREGQPMHRDGSLHLRTVHASEGWVARTVPRSSRGQRL